MVYPTNHAPPTTGPGYADVAQRAQQLLEVSLLGELSRVVSSLLAQGTVLPDAREASLLVAAHDDDAHDDDARDDAHDDAAHGDAARDVGDSHDVGGLGEVVVAHGGGVAGLHAPSRSRVCGACCGALLCVYMCVYFAC